MTSNDPIVALERRRRSDGALMQNAQVLSEEDLEVARRALTFPASETYDPDAYEIVELRESGLVELAPGVKVLPATADFLRGEIHSESGSSPVYAALGAICGEQLGLHPATVLELRRSVRYDFD
jgi:hypothetical protein